MGILDALRTHEPAAAPDYSTHGGQPGPHETGYLVESERTLAALDRHAAAADAAAAMQADAPTPIRPAAIIVETDVPNDFAVETFVIPPGQWVAIVGRDLTRRKLDIANVSGNGAGVALCNAERDAESGAKHYPPARSVTLPDGSARNEWTHTAPVWALCDPAAANPATVDVYVERKTRRP